LMRHTIDAFDSKGFANITAVYGVPISPGRCRLIVRQPFRFKNKIIRAVFALVPDFFSHLGNLNVLDDDNIFLHMQEREIVERGISEKPTGQVYYMPGASDSYVTVFRAWLQRTAGGGPFGPQNKEWLEKAGPRLSPAQILEHYHSHTEKCSICQKALARIKLLRVISAAVACLGAVTAFSLSLVRFVLGRSVTAAEQIPLAPLIAGGVILAVVGMAIFTWCSRTLPRFYQGERVPPRNRVPGEWTP
jgi:hypothetical protein